MRRIIEDKLQNMKSKNYKFIYILFVVVFILFSCGDKKKQIERELVALGSKTVVMPSEKILTLLGKDTIYNNITIKSQLKLVIYSDSLSCATCMAGKMYLWNKIVNNIHPFGSKVSLNFIFSPAKKDMNQLISTIQRNRFKYPIIIDSIAQFEKLNPHLPKNKALHTFLLDKDNKVILVGNPLNNPKIEEMFYKIVEEKLGKK